VLKFNPQAMIGEFRGWSSNGEDALGIQSFESDNIDLWETSLATGASRPLTDGAEYTDPNFMSPNGKWLVSEQVLGSGRLDFISAMQGIPPLTDQMGTTGYVSGIRNNGSRRFFLPYLVSTGDGASEQINAANDQDGAWNAAADPVWLASSTAVVWAENLVTSPACGGSNPSPCPVSTEPGGRDSPVMIARFPTLQPVAAAGGSPRPQYGRCPVAPPAGLLQCLSRLTTRGAGSRSNSTGPPICRTPAARMLTAPLGHELHGVHVERHHLGTACSVVDALASQRRSPRPRTPR
jgi:hypothetical protein